MAVRAGMLALCLACVASSSSAAAVQDVPPENLESLIGSQAGILVVSLTSTDPKCQPCMGANAKFEVLALGSNTVRFIQVGWQPWARFPAPVRELLSRYQLPFSIPLRLAFQDGKLIDKVVGEPAMPPQPRTFPQTGRVEVVEPLDALQRLQATRGIAVVMLSSFEPDCAFCMRANPVFEELAGSGRATGAAATFLRVMYRPWTAAGTDPFGKLVGVRGLPVFLTFKDGQAVRRNDGFAAGSELRKALLDGVD